MRRTVRIKADVLRPIVQKYLDGYETAEVTQCGNWKQSLSPTVILASEANVNERTMRSFLSAQFDTIDFDAADRILCSMGMGVLGWLQDEALRDAYYAANLERYDEPEKPPLTVRTCVYCDAGFMPKRSDQKYCSRDCRKRASWARELKNYPRKPCRWCGNEYQPHRNDSRYCSIPCMNHGKYHLEGGAEQQKRRRAAVAA